MRPMVVVGYDGSAPGRAAAHWAAREAVRRDLVLRLVDVAVPAESAPRMDVAAMAAELHASRPGLAIRVDELPGEVVESLVAYAAPHTELLVAAGRGADGDAGSRIGAVALDAAARATVPVVLVPAGGLRPNLAPSAYPVLLGVDPHRPLEASADFAFDVAHRLRVGLRAVFACPRAVGEERAPAYGLSREAEALADVLRPWRRKYPEVRVLEDVVPGPAAAALTGLSGCSELLVVGRSYGAGLGPVARAAASYADCPVVVVPG